MDKQIYNGNLPSGSQLSTTLKEAADFLQNIDNTKNKWKGLTYPEVFALVKNFVQTIEPEMDLENVSAENLIKYLNGILAQKENLESVVPQNLQEIVKEFEKAEGKAKIFEQKASQNVKNFLERQRLIAEKRNLQKPFREAADELAKTVAQKLSRQLPPDKQEPVIEAIIEEIGVQTDLELSLNKTSNLPPEEKQKEEQRIAEKIQNSFADALPQAMEKLRQKGIVITPEEEMILSRVIPSPEDLPLIVRGLTLPASQRKEMDLWFKGQLLPLASPEEALIIAKVFVPAMAEKLPEIDRNILDKLTENQFIETKAQIEEAVMIALAETAPEIGEISPKKISRIISIFVPQNKDELVKLSSLLTAPKENRTIISPSLSTEPVEVTQLPTKFPRIFASSLKRAAEGNVLHSKNDQGVRIVDEIRARLFQEGVNSGNALGFRNTVLRRWALNLTAQGITPEDIDFTLQRLIKAGEKPDSPRIRELKEIRQILEQHQQTLPTALLERIKKYGVSEGLKGNSFVQLPTQYNTAIIRQAQFNPRLNLITRINSFLGRTFGRKSVVSPSGQIIQINKFSFFAQRLFESIKAGFFRTSFGRGFQIGLQKLYSLVFTPRQTKKPTTVNLPLLSLKIGRQSLLLVGEKIIPPKLVRNFGEGIASIFTGQNRTTNSFLSSSQNLLSSLNSVSSMTTNIGGFLIKGLIAFILLAFVVIFGAGGAMYLPSFTITSGDKTPTGGCFSFVGNWSASEKELINESLTILLKYPNFINPVCSRGTINLIRVTTDDDYCSVELTLDINMPDKCLGNPENTLYSLSHELGHVLAVNSNLYFQFLDNVGNTEDFLCSYPLMKTVSEDFPETVAIYIMNRIYPNHSYATCDGPVNMINQYPIHYNFINGKL